jgi:hypothetical protein
VSATARRPPANPVIADREVVRVLLHAYGRETTTHGVLRVYVDSQTFYGVTISTVRACCPALSKHFPSRQGLSRFVSHFFKRLATTNGIAQFDTALENTVVYRRVVRTSKAAPAGPLNAAMLLVRQDARSAFCAALCNLSNALTDEQFLNTWYNRSTRYRRVTPI